MSTQRADLRIVNYDKLRVVELRAENILKALVKACNQIHIKTLSQISKSMDRFGKQ